MTKRNKIIYWIFTLWLCLGMGTGGVLQLIKMKENVEGMARLGYPEYFLTILGVWKILGVIAVLVPRFPLVKEWAYAGFFFVTTGALYTHFAMNDPLKEFFGSGLLLVLTVISWYFRPADRKLVSAESKQ
jgi:uncharacterized membrane protein YphA (DoxX/SURF4 family)